MIHDANVDTKQMRSFFILPLLVCSILCAAGALVLSGCSGGSTDKITAPSGSSYYQGKMNADSEGGVRKGAGLSATGAQKTPGK